jgi:hypothetical protein
MRTAYLFCRRFTTEKVLSSAQMPDEDRRKIAIDRAARWVYMKIASEKSLCKSFACHLKDSP